MVMIPVGNRTSHNLGIWCFVETYVRMLIASVVIFRAQDILTVGALRFVAILFFVWSYRPIYISFKHLYYSWRDAKHRAESDALSEDRE